MVPRPGFCNGAENSEFNLRAFIQQFFAEGGPARDSSSNALRMAGRVRMPRPRIEPSVRRCYASQSDSVAEGASLGFSVRQKCTGYGT